VNAADEEMMATQLIDAFAPNPDAVETHRIEIVASCETVYQTLWTTNLGSSPVVKGLLALRSLPELIVAPQHRRRANRAITLRTLIEAGFGLLAEEPGREVVLGIAGRFWRPTGNLVPFHPENFQGPVPLGLARAVWNFTVREAEGRRTLLSTQTRIVCGDAASRRKFRLYWLMVRPFSGLIRQLMLKAVRQACEEGPKPA
jgi:hypothetical protein